MAEEPVSVCGGVKTRQKRLEPAAVGSESPPLSSPLQLQPSRVAAVVAERPRPS